MKDRLQLLNELHASISQDPRSASRETRLQFWSIVREIKREAQPDDEEVSIAAEIREALFVANRGRTYALGPSLAIMGLFSILGVLGYVWVLGIHLDWTSILSWNLSDWGNFGIRFLFVFMVVAFFYPFGRLIAGKWMGIKIQGMCRDQYYEPTLKIDYVTFLKAPAPKRKWFFFIAGIWTLITSLWLGILGLFLDFDFTAFIPAVFIAVFEGYVVASGKPKASGGEMGHFNRERLIVNDWKKITSQS